jgi:hypothetical protein
MSNVYRLIAQEGYTLARLGNKLVDKKKIITVRIHNDAF